METNQKELFRLESVERNPDFLYSQQTTMTGYIIQAISSGGRFNLKFQSWNI